ncbi:MAG: cation diffusion facilitator family transporter [Desulfobulbaceae bacterium]|nr:cation diffusion facilitator family transporter [Desulfobulbaceae bacterium]
MSHGANSLKSIFFALAANAAIAVAKFSAALYTGSGAMMAESIHSLADSGNQLLLLLGIRMAKKPPSADYPLGHGKEIYFWSFIVALILFSMGGLFSIYEGVHKLGDPQPLNAPYVAIAVLVFSMIAEGLSLWGCMREVNKERQGMSIWQWFRETRRSELLVVFGEDSAALLGLSFATLAVVGTMVTGNPTYDALGSVCIGILLIVIAFFIGIEVKSLLVGQGVPPAVKQQMLGFLEARPEVDKVYNLLTLQLGDDVMVAVKARMREEDSSRVFVENINRCEAGLRQQFPQILWLFFEPDIAD